MLDTAVDLWATDEVHFQQHGSRCRMWIPPEIKDPILFHAPTRKSVGYFGAVRLRDGKFLFRRESGRFNAETFFQFLLRNRAEDQLIAIDQAVLKFAPETGTDERTRPARRGKIAARRWSW